MAGDVAQFQVPDFSVAADLLAGDGTNTFRVDAAGFLRVSNHLLCAESDAETAAKKAGLILRAIGEFAVLACDEHLANHIFELEDTAGRLRLYGEAEVTGSIDEHTDWLIQLESDEVQAEIAQSPAVAAEQKLVGIGIALSEYAAARSDASRAQALGLARKIKSDFLAGGVKNLVLKWEFENKVDLLFAAHGLWQDVDASHPDDPYSVIELGNQLVVKAAAGRLTWRDKRRLGRSFDLRTLIAVDALANGIDIPERKYVHGDSLIGSILLATAAPEIYMHLGLSRRSQVDVTLKVGNDEKAVRDYHTMRSYKGAFELLVAALHMAPHFDRLKAVRGAHGVYQRIVTDQIEKIRSFTASIDWRNEPKQEADAMQPIIHELASELNNLDDTVDRLLACVQQLQVAVEVDPSSDEADMAMFRLRECWDSLELMESSNELLPEIAILLKKNGIGIYNQWKYFRSYNGYVGYGLTEPRIAQAVLDPIDKDTSFFVSFQDLKRYRIAAQKLNELHGQQRFKIYEFDEFRQGTGEQRREMIQRIRLDGNWRERGLYIGELVAARDTAIHIDGSLDTLPVITNRLMALQLADA